ncbi:diaminopimelate epimerase [Acetobacter oeni]|uniref:Diaminopimelate epimerase n=1 Tax=Acetobacter oeni TaxID=304077 RepID=A0A511XFZ1_9PROT|nr:diaminopimelate epimerase [Acetobacter oeni]MBB3882269.1 diaminopimelate epimerase [Acetobacter oeni]NHO18022.1 diaminopimelate epimerase [Acetobacter oeni]GBR01156.1 diaminopimelate epimerase [Acetobacter oeni LMG 21952]GEN61811.1 diaminopimelate epimerase [Acetobacter oeni]
MSIHFRKMHGLGNDFIVVDERKTPRDFSPTRIAALADRRRGIGCDQFVTLTPALNANAQAFVRFFNPDGSEAGACGNASRCVASLLATETGQSDLTLQTRAGLLTARVLPAKEEGRATVTVDMGRPRTGWQDVPLAEELDTLRLPLDGEPAALSMGNPHVTFFVDDLAEAERGPALEMHPLFPDRANIGFARIDASDHMRLRVWERGAGFTLACGSGACAAAVNAVRRGLAGRRMTVEVDGGEMLIAWDDNDHVQMTGPAQLAFEGTVDPEAYPK